MEKQHCILVEGLVSDTKEGKDRGVGGVGVGGVLVPFLFAALERGVRDIQAFTEHCFTTAGDKVNTQSGPARNLQQYADSHLPLVTYIQELLLFNRVCVCVCIDT